MDADTSNPSVGGLQRADATVDRLDTSSGTVVLVEGDSDAAAVSTIAARVGTAHALGLQVVSANGVTNYRRLIARIRIDHPTCRIVGVYDEPEERVVGRALESVGPGSPVGRADLERLGFHACVADLEDEFIRAMGVERVEQVVAEQGEIDAFRIMQRQPAQRGRPVDQQLRRFMGTKATRKIRYGHLLASAVDLDACPRPLRLVVADR